MRSCLIALSLLLAACGDPKPAQAGSPAMPPMPAGVATPVNRELPVERLLTGQIEATQWVELRARIGGTITEVLVADGAEVQAGTLLFRIDRAPVEASLHQAQADLARAKAHREQAQLQFDRAKSLIAQETVSRQLFDDAQAGLHAAEAEVASATAAVERAGLDVGYTEVRAPITGRIGRVLATTGNLIQASGVAPGTLLATLVAIDPVYAAFDVDEELWHSIGARLRASADAGGQGELAIPVRVGLPGEPDFRHLGAVAVVDNRIDAGSGSMRIRARMANADRALTPGAFARIRLQIAPPRPVLLVNEKAVLAQLATRYVLTVDAQGITAFRPVRLGESVDGLRVVESGLKADDRIAVNNLAKIFFPGQPVTPVPASMITLQNEAAQAPAAAGKP